MFYSSDSSSDQEEKGERNFIRTFAGVVLDGDTTSRYGALLGVVGDVGEGHAFGEVISSLESRHFC